MAYRISRNIEASIMNFLEDEFSTAGWNNIAIEKTFSRVKGIQMNENTGTGIVCVRVGLTEHDKIQIGDNATQRFPQVFLDIFAINDGQRLDIKDFLVEKLRGGLPYYEYVIVNGEIDTKTQNGRIRVMEILDTPINFDEDKSRLDIHDRYRHLLTLTVSLGRVEA